MSDEINEKMEQIRIKNEELEKKHQEILQDELEAKKQGATVSKSQAVSCKTNEKHRYDNVELDYDVKDEQKEHAKNPDYKPKSESFVDILFAQLFMNFLLLHTTHL